MARTEVVGMLTEAGKENKAEHSVIARRLLARPPEALQHSGPFTGRLGTRVHADETWVLKLREDRCFDVLEIARAWTERRLREERRYGVHHPDRTWIIVETARGWVPANLSPRLAPLHVHDWTLDPDPVNTLASVVRLYLRFWRMHGRRLDEGLSNFGLDASGRLFYLDDDFFASDEHRSFAAMLGQWLRMFGRDWLGEDEARVLGSTVHDVLGRAPAIETRLVVEALHEIFVPAFATRQREIMIAAILGHEESPRPHLDWHRPVGVIADVHGNLEALDAVLHALELYGVQQFLCLGDVVGYGPHPRACIARIRDLGIPCIMGNHDYYVAHGTPARVAMSRMATIAAEWTRAQLSEDELAWLADLPLKREDDLDGHRILAVHGAPVDPTYFNAYVYERTWERNLDWMQEHDVWLCLYGHSHLQGGYAECYGLRERVFGVRRFALDGCTHALVNPGAVGQPRNGTCGAQAAIVRPNEVCWLTVEYDVDRVVQEIMRAGLPPELGRRLLQGR